ncbi:hypothetical protein AYO40_01105 [Planctomycetaceae bacterium SCGC AG-212-D15]|nr:hypothetical protein AYO40_01105 [Planctomycetaceae bacterium SCGC AG-212-D15]
MDKITSEVGRFADGSVAAVRVGKRIFTPTPCEYGSELEILSMDGTRKRTFFISRQAKDAEILVVVWEAIYRLEDSYAVSSS